MDWINFLIAMLGNIIIAYIADGTTKFYKVWLVMLVWTILANLIDIGGMING